MIRLVVFDLDGTLVDSLRDLAASANALLAECGARPLPDDAVGRMVGEGAALLVSRAFSAAGVVQPADALARFLAVYEGRLLDHTRAYDGVPELLTRLAPIAALAVLTNKPLASTRHLLQALDLARFFDPEAVVGGDGPFPRKPDPHGLRALAARAGVSIEATLLVGDSAIDWRTARNAGARLCLAGYGFGFESVPLAELTPEERIVDAPLDVLSLPGFATF